MFVHHLPQDGQITKLYTWNDKHVQNICFLKIKPEVYNGEK